ncbi:protein of unknown function (DUF4388) [Actinobacteria bacterium IMCC26207]|nr:protein of unknown function (DUF4388) [Actinobacteria bacterium IMCC26207]
MPLQGTIDSFPLADVLSLLNSSSRLGRLTVRGDRHTGWIEVAGGFLNAAEIEGKASLEPRCALFELLRCTGGDFEFLALDKVELSDATVEGTSLADCLEESELRLKRWEEIEQVLPSTAHRIELVRQLPSDEIVVDPLLWSLLVAVQGTSAVCDVVERVRADELDVCAALALLVAEGLAKVSEPLDAAAFDAAVLDEAAVDTETHPQIPVSVPIEVVETPFPQHFPIDDLVGSSEADSSDLWHRTEEFVAPPATDSTADSLDTAVSMETVTAAAAWDQLVSPLQDLQELDPASYEELEDTPSTQEDVFRQMSTLSPQAADAIAAALNARPVLDHEGSVVVSGRDADNSDAHQFESTIVEAQLASEDSSDDMLGLVSPQGEFPAVAGLGEDEGPLGPISFIGSF